MHEMIKSKNATMQI